MIYTALALGALAAGIITAIAGGGGVLIVAFLMMLDIPIKIIIGTNKVSALFDNATSTYNYYKKGKMNIAFLKYAIIPSLFGTVLGAKLLYLIKGKTIEKLIPFVLLLLVSHSLFNKKVGMKNEFIEFTRRNLLFGIVFTFLMGVYSGFFGVAAGSFFTLGLVYIFKFDFLEAVATVKPIVAFTGLIAVIFYAAYGLINYKYAIFIAVFRVVGSRIGSNYASEKGSKLVRPIFLALCLFTIGKELFL